MWIYYFRSNSGNEYLDWSEKQMDVVQAIMFFGWDCWEDWLNDGYLPEEIPYQQFLRTKIPWVKS